jgi:predicted RNase H-like HicB family nuclease
MRPFNVFVSHDAADGVWFVESSDIPGLNAEAESYEALVEIILDVAPDLIEVNVDDQNGDLPNIPVLVQHQATAKRVAAH